MIEGNDNFIGKGLQKYGNDGDTLGKWLTISVFQEAIKNVKGLGTNSILDVGCGNGRLNVVHEQYFNRIVGIDKFRDPSPKYCVPSFEFRNADIFDISEKFSVVLFMGSFYMHCCYGYLETLMQVKKIMRQAGNAIIIDDKKRNVDHALHDSALKLKNGYYCLDDLCLKSGLKIDYKFINKNTPFSLYSLNEV